MTGFQKLFRKLPAAVVFTCCSALAQNSIQVFSPVNVRPSQQNASFGNPVTFNSATLNLNCPKTGITAIVSSTSDGSGNVLVDNFINLTVSQDGWSTGPVNICRGGVVEHGDQEDCFTVGYQTPAKEGKLTGQDPDNFTSTGGVDPLDISGDLWPGLNQVTIDLVDTGVYVASSTIYLKTSCTQMGVSGPATISGNPISSTNPTPQELTQSFGFNSGTGQQISEIFDLAQSEKDGELTIQNGTIPTVADIPLDPALWQSDYVKGTSFSTSNCLVHTGELLPNGSPACKLFTVTCKVGTGSTGSGAQCPVSKIRDEVFEDFFDGPAFTLPDINAGKYGTFHQGIGYLMAKEGWTGLSCLFDPASGLEADLCPQNTLTLFTGPGTYGGRGTTTHPNSTFISIAPVPEDRTEVHFNYCAHEKWINRDTVEAYFKSDPPVVPEPNNDFVAAPIASITYGISPKDQLPSTEFPIPTDTVLTNPVACPAPGSPNPPPAEQFVPENQQITFPGEGKFLLHFFATDCAGTEELKFTKNSSGSWTTTFYTREINVDTEAPKVSYGPILNPAPTKIHGVLGYHVGQKVTASYECTDNLSGVEKCGDYWFAEETRHTGIKNTDVDTSRPGAKTFTVHVRDYAGNEGTPVNVSYEVVK